MTVSSTNRKAGPYYGNGVTAAFPFSFKVFAASDLLVVKTNLTTGVDTVLAATDYSVSLTADTTGGYSGGTVTLTAGALASTYTLTITSSILYTQNTDLTNNGGFYPKVINSALDRLTILCQQLLEQVSRSLKLSISTPPGVTPTLPAPVKNNMIAWNANGDGLQNLDPQALATIVAFGTANSDKFSGDGTTTQFALSNNPGALNNLDVSIGGVTQRPGIDYTWSAGTVITFTTAPATGTNNILVRYMQGLPQGYTTGDLVQVNDGAGGSLFGNVAGFITRLMSSSGSALVGFIQAGVGAVTRTTQDKLRDVVSVTDFGSDFSNPTACRAAILKAHQASKRVRYPSGTYNLGNLSQSGSVQDVAVDFTGLGTIHMDTGPDVVFTVNMTTPGIAYAFKFDGNSHSTVGDCRIVGSGYNPAATWQGVSPFLLTATTGDWGNISFGKITCSNVVQPIVAARVTESDGRIRGIKISKLFLDNTYYGYNGSNQGDDVEIGSIYHYQGYRALFTYGCNSVVAKSIVVRNPRSTTGTICVASYPGFPTSGIDFNLKTYDVAVGATVNHILFENFGPDYSVASITGCTAKFAINDPNASNPLVKIVTYTTSGGVETSTSTAASFNNNNFDGVALGNAKSILCTAQYTSPQKNSVEGRTAELLDVSALQALRWSSVLSYTPSWTADGGTNPTLGNGTLLGEFYVEDKRMHVNIFLQIGSTTTLGSGAWYLWNPYQIPTKATLLGVVGSARVLHGGAYYLAAVTQGISALNVQLTVHGSGNQVGPTVPWSWVAGDSIVISYSFPI